MLWLYRVKGTLDIQEHNNAVFPLHDMGFNLVDKGGGGSFCRSLSTKSVLLWVQGGRGQLPVDMPDAQAFETFNEIVSQGNWPICLGYVV